MLIYQAVSVVFLFIGSCFIGGQTQPQFEVSPSLRPGQQLLCASTSYEIQCTIQGENLVWQVLNGSEIVFGQPFSSIGSNFMPIPREGFLFTLVNVSSGIVSTVSFNTTTTENNGLDMRCLDTVNTMQETISIGVYAMIPPVTFDTTCITINWNKSPCAVEYNVSTDAFGFMCNTSETTYTICEIPGTDTVHVQPIDGNGVGGIITSINVTNPELEPLIMNVTVAVPGIPAINITENVTVTVTVTESPSPPCPIPLWCFVILIVAVVASVGCLVLLCLLGKLCWDRKSKSVRPDQEVSLKVPAPRIATHDSDELKTPL